MSPVSTYPTLMTTCTLDATVMDAIREPALLGGIVDKTPSVKVWGAIGTICNLASYIQRVI